MGRGPYAQETGKGDQELRRADDQHVTHVIHGQETHGEALVGIRFQHLHDQGGGSSGAYVFRSEVISWPRFNDLGFRNLYSIGFYVDEWMRYVKKFVEEDAEAPDIVGRAFVQPVLDHQNVW